MISSYVDDLEVEQPQRAALVVQAVDQVLDVGRRILLAHQPGRRVLELAAVDEPSVSIGNWSS